MTADYYIGFSAKHITRPTFNNISFEDRTWHTQLPVDWYFVAGCRFGLTERWSVRPELMMRYVQTVPLSVNFGAHLYYTNNYSFGANFMTGQKAVSFVVKAMLTNYFRVGYSYDIYYGPIRHLQRGSHEIMVNYYIRNVMWGDRRRGAGTDL
jgi:type IX secretion system PorP/SprF family membrane protein